MRLRDGNARSIQPIRGRRGFGDALDVRQSFFELATDHVVHVYEHAMALHMNLLWPDKLQVTRV